MHMSLSEVASQLQFEHVGEDAEFERVSTDTRTISQGDLFVALRGEHFDGHDYVLQAQQSGASAAMVSEQLKVMLPMLRVDDTRLGLGQLSSLWRGRFDIPFAAITGSNGKTTVKEMLSSIMSQQGKVLFTQGNLNNDIGVPLTLLRLQDFHDYAVIEMGANHQNEILYLTDLVRPNVAVITNAAAAHLEGFGSLDGVAHAKGEIFTGLNMNGTAVINADDVYAPLWKSLVGKRKLLSFGLDSQADITAQWNETMAGTQLMISLPDAKTVSLTLALPGRHNVMNALAATAAAVAMGASEAAIKTGLEAMVPVNGRLQKLKGQAGMVILNDTYNANPASFAAAIDVLISMSGHSWLVLGDMGELGTDSQQLHVEMGRMAREKGVQCLYATGALSQHAVKGFGENGYWFENKDELTSQLSSDWQGEGAVLVKGSRLMHMEEVVSGLQAGDKLA